MVTFTILILTFISVLSIYKQAFAEYNKVRLRSDYVKARYFAQSWMVFAVNILSKIPENQLYMFGIFDGPKPFSYNNKAQVIISITDETGKINLNYLVNNNYTDQSVNMAIREMLDRLSESMGISYDRWDAVIDWIDDNDIKMPFGYEKQDYALMNPPRRIKNSYLHSVEELMFIPGFDTWTLYADRRTDEEKRKYSKDFMTEEELMTIHDSDFILSNNITAYMPEKTNEGDWKININSAPYHVILALSEFITPEVARAIIVERIKNGGYFSNISDLEKISQLHLPTVGKITLLQEIAGRINYSGRIYKIIVDVSVGSKTARVMGFYDTNVKKIISYLE
ncbi:MAG: general secretion pathway protein GspK [Spirochaetia bacterium]|nr:general secretion pathway protein GspK [Spirochaetia bacterium]